MLQVSGGDRMIDELPDNAQEPATFEQCSSAYVCFLRLKKIPEGCTDTGPQSGLSTRS